MIPGWLIYEIYRLGYIVTSVYLMFKVFVPDFKAGKLERPLLEFAGFLFLNLLWPVWLIRVIIKNSDNGEKK